MMILFQITVHLKPSDMLFEQILRKKTKYCVLIITVINTYLTGTYLKSKLTHSGSGIRNFLFLTMVTSK